MYKGPFSPKKNLFLAIMLVICINWYFSQLFMSNNGVFFVNQVYHHHHHQEFEKKIQRASYNISCPRIIEWNEQELNKANSLLEQMRSETGTELISGTDILAIPVLDDSNFVFDQDKCDAFKEIRGYDKHFVQPFEIEFPLAYIILTYNNVEQFERLLRAIYRPQNIYCIHPDAKSPEVFHRAVQSIVRCFPNVFITTKLEHVVYEHYSRLQADFNCMQDLITPDRSHPNLKDKVLDSDEPPKWKYLLNTASTEFPLKTNYELVKIFEMFNGANDIEAFILPETKRVKYKWIVKTNNSKEYLKNTNVPKSPPPHGYVIYKGIAYCVFSRKFVEYIFESKEAADLRKWAEDTSCSEEWYWATIHANLQFNPPGGSNVRSRNMIESKLRYYHWVKTPYSQESCNGAIVHDICIYSAPHLQLFINRPEYFLNKLFLHFDPIMYECIEGLYMNKVAAPQNVQLVDYCFIPSVVKYTNNKECIKRVNIRALMKENDGVIY